MALAGCAGTPTPPTNIANTSATLKADARVDQGDNPVSWWWQIATSEAGIGAANRNGSTARCVSGPVNAPPGEYNNLSCDVTGLSPATTYYYKFCGDTARISPTCSSSTQQFATCGRPWLRASGSARDPSEPGVELDVAAQDCLQTGVPGIDKLRVYIDDQLVYSDTVPCTFQDPNVTCARGISRQLQLPFGRVIGTHAFRFEAENHEGVQAAPIRWTGTTPAEGTISRSTGSGAGACKPDGSPKPEFHWQQVGTRIRGTPCDDVIVAKEGVTSIRGREGDDRIYGNNQRQVIIGGPDDDTIFGERGNDKLIGNGGADRIYGGVGDDHVLGGGGNDLLAGGFGTDRIKGQNGDDLVRGGGTGDTLYGQGGTDTLSYADGVTPGYQASGEHGVKIDLNTGRATSTQAPNGARYGGGLDKLPPGSSFDRIIGSQFDDHIIGTSGLQTIDAGPGADVVEGRGGGDHIYGGADGDSLNGGGSGDLHGGAGSDGCAGGATTFDCERQDSAVVPRDPGRISVGFLEPDDKDAAGLTLPYTALVLNGSDQRDRVEATYAGGTVTFTNLEGPGFDPGQTAGGCSFQGNVATCVVPGDQRLDALQLAGAGGDDVLRTKPGFPDTTSVMLLGGPGVDELTTTGHTEDVLIDGPSQGGAGRELLSGADRADQLVNNDGADDLRGGTGDDVLLSASVCQNDKLAGGRGKDNASWAQLDGGAVFAEIGGRIGRPGGGGQAECSAQQLLGDLEGVEDLEGSSQDDTLVGDQHNNDLLGRDGSDILRGEAGSDKLSANDGGADNVLNCGPDQDPRPVVDFARFNDPPTIGCEGSPKPKKAAYMGTASASASDAAERLDVVEIGRGESGPSPAAFYELDEATGTTAADWTGDGADGTYVNGPTLRVPGALVDSGTAVRLDGQNDYIDLTSAWDPGATPNDCSVRDWSIEMWVKFNGPPAGEQYLFSRSVPGGSGTFVYRSPDGRINLKTTHSTGSLVSTDDPVSAGAWHHVVATLEQPHICPSLAAAPSPPTVFGPDKMTLYIDGFAFRLGYSRPLPNATPSAHNLVGVKTGLTGWLNADVDDVAIYEDALTQDEVALHLAISNAQDADPLLLSRADRTDGDADGVVDPMDNCEDTPNPNQADTDLNGIGDACDLPPDSDGDDVPDAGDNCPAIYNSDQLDGDSDGIGDACDASP